MDTNEHEVTVRELSGAFLSPDFLGLKRLTQVLAWMKRLNQRVAGNGRIATGDLATRGGDHVGTRTEKRIGPLPSLFWRKLSQC